MYDYQGRPVIQVLPAPSLSRLIHYTPNFSVDINNAEYDKPNTTVRVFIQLLRPRRSAMGTQSGLPILFA